MLAIFLPISDAQAQGDTSLVVEPEVSYVPLGNEILLELVVTGGLNVNAYDVTIVYDEDKLELISWEHGDYLSNLAVVKLEDDPGQFRLAATQLATPAVSGDGVLLVLTFSAKEIGTASVEISEAAFADSEGNLAYPDCEPGDVQVTGDPTFTATATQTIDPASKGTQTPTVTRTPTKTKTPTASRTPTPTQKTSTPSVEAYIPSATRTATNDIHEEENTESALGLTETENTGFSQVDDAYPAQETPTITSVSDVADQPDELDASDHSEENGDHQISSTDQVKWANVILWIVLITGLLAILILFIVLISRQRNKQEDLLL